MTTSPDLQRAADLLTEILQLLYSTPCLRQQSNSNEFGDDSCTAPSVKCSDCNEMDTTEDFLPEYS